VAPRPDVSSGKLETHRFVSDVLKNERRISVYTPPKYDEKRDYPLVVFVDRYAYLTLIPTPTILDNMIADKAIPPMVAVFIGIPSATRERELSCDPAFTNFAAHELINWVRKNYKVTKKPEEMIIAGSSQGAVAAAYIGTRHSDTYGNVLSQSGLYWYTPQSDPEYEWFTRYLASLPRSNVKFYLEVGSLERGGISSDGPSIILANRHLRDILNAKGYSLYYSEFSGGHDYICWQGSLSDGLTALTGEEEEEERRDEMPEEWRPIPE
jgi:enterochelin esterase family protein